MAVKIVTDSTASLPVDVIEQYDIRVVPLQVSFGHDTYRDGVDLSSEQFYSKLVQADKLPTTSQPPVGDFLKAYQELTGDGDEVISIHMTGRWTGTVDTARSAAAMLPDALIHIVDSQFTALALEMMVRKAAEAAASGRDSPFILERLERMIRHTAMALTLDTLEYFQKGGRIGPVRALLGTLLSIKPVLIFEDGIVIPGATVRTKRKAIRFVADYLIERAAGHPVYLSLANGGVPQEMEELRQLIIERVECLETYVNTVSPVIGTHAGPGAVGAGICPADIVDWDG